MDRTASCFFGRLTPARTGSCDHAARRRKAVDSGSGRGFMDMGGGVGEAEESVSDEADAAAQ